MSNATLVIHNGKQFAENIWDDGEDFTEDEWKTVIMNMWEATQKAYNFLNNKTDYPADDLYQLGDVCNLLFTMDVTKEG